MELRRFFDQAIRASFADLACRDDQAAEYLADMLTRFARTENLFPRGSVVPRLETVVDMLLEIQGAWQDDAPSFRPEREVSVRRHIGDFTLFGPAVQLYTPLHPFNAEQRRREEFGKPIEIGSDVWVGGGAIILAG